MTLDMERAVAMDRAIARLRRGDHAPALDILSFWPSGVAAVFADAALHAACAIAAPWDEDRRRPSPTCDPGIVEVARRCLLAGAEPDGDPNDRHAPLAIVIGHDRDAVGAATMIVRMLLRHGARTTAGPYPLPAMAPPWSIDDCLRRDFTGRPPTDHLTALLADCLHPGTAERLIALGADPDGACPGGSHPLHRNAMPAVVDVLLRHGADPGLTDANGRLPASWFGILENGPASSAGIAAAIEDDASRLILLLRAGSPWPPPPIDDMGVDRTGNPYRLWGDILDVVAVAAGRDRLAAVLASSWAAITGEETIARVAPTDAESAWVLDGWWRHVDHGGQADRTTSLLAWLSSGACAPSDAGMITA